MRSLTSLQHPLIKHMVKLRQDRRYRTSQKRVIVSGRRLVAEIAQQVEVYAALADPSIEVPNEIPTNRVYQVPDNVVKKVSGLAHPDGLVAEVGIPQPTTLNGAERLLVIDRIRDPGNLGTLIRTALALGWDGLFLLDESVDPFNDKAVRAARAASLFLPYRFGSRDDLLELVKSEPFALIVADAKGAPLDRYAPQGKIALLLGNEGSGPAEELVSAATTTLSVPMSGRVESLNVAVAGSIFLYYLGGSHG